MNRSLFSVALVALAGCAADPTADVKPRVYVEALTWMEVRSAIDAGTTSVIIPTGGTEQNGPHMALGKHNVIIHHTAGAIATRLGNTLVAPVMAYVPEGNVDPLSGHMRMAGTITLPNEHFITVLEWAARSFAAHGFTDILLIGDSGGNQRGMQAVAEALNAEWTDENVRVHHIVNYYNSNNGNVEWLISQGETEEDIGSHAGITDTSQLMALDSTLVRPELFAVNGGAEGSGVRGNPTRASAAYGRQMLEQKIEAAVRQARQLIGVR